MTDYQDNCAHSTAEQIETVAHDLSHSSEPTGTEPTFQPVATGPAKTSDEALIRLADEVVDLARRERDAYSALGDLGAADPREAALTAEAKALEATILDRFLMQSLIRADTLSGLVAKGRAVLAYRESLENCQIPELQPLLISMAEDTVRFTETGGWPWTIGVQPKDQLGPDSTLLTLGAELDQLWAEDHRGEDAGFVARTERAYAVARSIEGLCPTTLAGVRVRARAAVWACNANLEEQGTQNQMMLRLLRDIGALDDMPHTAEQPQIEDIENLAA